MARITTTFTTTPASVLRSYRACHRRVYRFRCAASAALVVLGVATRSPGLALAGAVFFLVAEASVRRQLRPYLRGPATVTVMITDDEYRTDALDRATARTWTVFQSVRRVGDFWVLRISTAAAMSLPASALDDAQTADFTSLLRAKNLLRE